MIKKNTAMIKSDNPLYKLPFPKKKLSKAEKEAICMKCPALCCHDLAMAIKRPSTSDEIQELKWRLHFENMDIIIRKHRWYHLIRGKCMYLGDDNLCTIYEQRSETCRAHNPPDCERFAHFYDHIIRTPEELDDYLQGNWYEYKRG